MRIVRGLVFLGVVSFAPVLGGCGYNEIQVKDQAVKAAWAEVLSQYKRRSDLIPNVVAAVKGEANFEQSTLTAVIEARAKASSIQVTPELANDAVALQRFEQAQGALGAALSRLLVVSERYPTLRANQGFQDLRVELEGTENRIAIARHRYIEAVEAYNVYIKQLPQNLTAMALGMKERPQFAVEDEKAAATPPTVDFGAKH